MNSPDAEAPATSSSEQWAGALGSAWRAMQHRHPDLAAIDLTPAAVASLSPRDDQPSGEAMLATVLHQATHSLAEARGITDTTARGYRHTRAFAELATEVGLTVAEAGPRGWQHTTLAAGTAEDYAGEIAQLAAALAAYRPDKPETGPNTRTTTSRNYMPATCGCQPARRIRTSSAELDRGQLLCGICDVEFTAASPDTKQPKSGSQRGRRDKEK